MNVHASLLTIAAALVAIPTIANAEVTTFELRLSGNQEVPGPGDPDGQATGTLSIDDASGQISWNITYTGIAAPAAMHIHTGAAGAGGGVAIPLNVETSGAAGTLIGSAMADTAAVAPLLATPESFYVNVHNADFRGGAIRGQLRN